jgi:hypothetical protein
VDEDPYPIYPRHESKQAIEKKANRKTANENLFVFFYKNILEVGERKMRGKWQIL